MILIFIFILITALLIINFVKKKGSGIRIEGFLLYINESYLLVGLANIDLFEDPNKSYSYVCPSNYKSFVKKEHIMNNKFKYIFNAIYHKKKYIITDNDKIINCFEPKIELYQYNLEEYYKEMEVYKIKNNFINSSKFAYKHIIISDEYIKKISKKENISEDIKNKYNDNIIAVYNDILDDYDKTLLLKSGVIMVILEICASESIPAIKVPFYKSYYHCVDANSVYFLRTGQRYEFNTNLIGLKNMKDEFYESLSPNYEIDDNYYTKYFKELSKGDPVNIYADCYDHMPAYFINQILDAEKKYMESDELKFKFFMNNLKPIFNINVDKKIFYEKFMEYLNEGHYAYGDLIKDFTQFKLIDYSVFACLGSLKIKFPTFYEKIYNKIGELYKEIEEEDIFALYNALFLSLKCLLSPYSNNILIINNKFSNKIIELFKIANYMINHDPHQTSNPNVYGFMLNKKDTDALYFKK